MQAALVFRLFENPATDLLELSPDQAADRTTEFREGIVPLVAGNGKRSSVPPRKAVVATRD